MRVSLFWRTFLLIGGLIVTSLLGTLQMVREIDRSPPEQQLAWEIASIVNLTRSALVSSQGERRRQLLDELVRVEGVRVTPLESSDEAVALPDTGLAHGLLQRLRTLLGPDTLLAGQVNGEAAIWVSFDIDGDPYWLVLSLERLNRQLGPPWWLVASLTTLLAILGALAISRLVNRPLAGLAIAMRELTAGAPARKLPEDGPSEIAGLNRRFNRMAGDLAELEADRALALAGISHDIRTPLTRLRMEIELSPLAEEDKQTMAADIERIDRIVGKFVEYGRSGSAERGAAPSAPVDVADLVHALAHEYRPQIDAGELRLDVAVPAGLQWRGDPVDLTRIITNLLENTLRYARQGNEPAIVELRALRANQGCLIEIRDHGPGVPGDQIDRLLRPFARLDDERSERGGSGLGLAIANRLARRYSGQCRLSNHPAGGLVVTVTLPDVSRSREPDGPDAGGPVQDTAPKTQ